MRLYRLKKTKIGGAFKAASAGAIFNFNTVKAGFPHDSKEVVI